MGWKSLVAGVAASLLVVVPVQAAEKITSISKDATTGHEVLLVDDGRTIEFRTGGPSYIFTAILIDVDGDGAVTPYVDTEYAGNATTPCPAYQLSKPVGASTYCRTLKTSGTYGDETVGAVRITRWKIPYVELSFNRRSVSYRLRIWNDNTKTSTEKRGVYAFSAPFQSKLFPTYQTQIDDCQSPDIQLAAKALAGCNAVIASGLADPLEASALYQTRGLLKAKAKDYAGALADLDTSIAKAQTADQRGLSEYLRSEVYRLTGRPADQAAELDRALASYPGAFDARLKRGDLRERAGRYTDAVTDYEEARRMAPSYPVLLNALCWNRAANLNIDLPKARKDCDEAVRLTPDESTYRDSRGMVALRESAWQAAFDDYTVAIGLNPDSASAWYGRAIAASRLSMKARAASDLAKARALSSTVEGDYARRGLAP